MPINPKRSIREIKRSSRRNGHAFPQPRTVHTHQINEIIEKYEEYKKSKRKIAKSKLKA